MFRIILLFFLTAFLFISILFTAETILKSDARTTRNLFVQAAEYETNRPSIRQIETASADNNFSFTIKNSLR